MSRSQAHGRLTALLVRSFWSQSGHRKIADPVKSTLVDLRDVRIQRLAATTVSGLESGRRPGGQGVTIERGLSLEVLGPTKTSRHRRLTLGATTAAMVVEHFGFWRDRCGAEFAMDDWMFSPDPRRWTNARAGLLSVRFDRLRTAAGLPDAALHRFRHSVGTHLVGEGKILKAQARLGHRDPATTLRHYAHATPLDDQDVADEIDELLNGATASTDNKRTLGRGDSSDHAASGPCSSARSVMLTASAEATSQMRARLAER